MANVVLIDPKKSNTSFPMQDGRSNMKKKGTIHQQDYKSYLLTFLQELFESLMIYIVTSSLQKCISLQLSHLKPIQDFQASYLFLNFLYNSKNLLVPWNQLNLHFCTIMAATSICETAQLHKKSHDHPCFSQLYSLNYKLGNCHS